MLFEKIADFILKHSKAIVVIWIVILLASIYPALHSNDVMKYDLNDMASSDSESIKGLTLISTDFLADNTVPDTSSIQILVIKYDGSPGSKENAQGFVGYMNSKLDDFTEDGVRKVTAVLDASSFIEVKDGVVLAGIVYATDDAVKIVNDTPALRDFIAQCKSTYPNNSGFATYLTGTPAISYDMEHNSLEDISKIDPFTILLILVLVGLFFRSFVTSATPPITIGIAFAVTSCAMFFLGHVLNIFFITQMMILVSMMGAGCDYCIFIIARYREELRAGKDHHEALREAITWAGESITTSGCSVIIGFGAMALCSYSLVTTMGICLAIGILFALIAALTFIPALLNLVGDKIFWPSRMSSFEEGGKSTKGWYAWCGNVGKKYFDWSAKVSIKYAVPIVVVALVATVPAAYYTLTNETSYDMIGSMQSGESGAGMDLLGEYANYGVLLPDYVLLEYKDGVGTVVYTSVGSVSTGSLTWSDSFKNVEYPKLLGLEADIVASDPDNIASVSGIFMWEPTVEAIKQMGITDSAMIIATLSEQSPYLGKVLLELANAGMDPDTIVYGCGPVIDYNMNCLISKSVGGEFAKVQTIAPDQPYGASLVKITVTTQASAMSITSMKTIDKFAAVVNDFAANNTAVQQKWITGGAVVMNDISHVFSSEFRIIEIVVVVLIMLLLFFVMKSYLIPVRSIITILMSITWTLSLTYFIFVTIGGGDLTWLAPMMLLVICLGLGMDYDILLTTRIKENVIKGMSNDDAIYHAVTTTGSVITICGLIMGGAFGTLMLSGMEMMKEFGFALCFAILVDALVVRTYIVPAVMHLLGKWNWVGPSFLQRNRQ